jgi:hypothetical protein
MDIPDWLWQNEVSDFFTEGLMLAAWLAWKYRGRLNEVYRYMLVLLGEILASVTLAHHQGELAPTTDNSAELEELREVLRNLTQKIDPFAPIRKSIKDGLKAPIPTAQYIPHKVRYVPPRVSHQPMQIRYRSPKIGFANGLPHVVPAGVDYEPPRFKVTPPSLEFVPGGVRLVMRTT